MKKSCFEHLISSMNLVDNNLIKLKRFESILAEDCNKKTLCDYKELLKNYKYDQKKADSYHKINSHNQQHHEFASLIQVGIGFLIILISMFIIFAHNQQKLETKQQTFRNMNIDLTLPLDETRLCSKTCKYVFILFIFFTKNFKLAL